MKNSTYDFIIIGAGVVGSMIARWLSRYQADILLIDKEADIGMGATAANSAIVHPGYDPQPGSLKALTNVRANPMWDQLSAELNFAFQRPGDFVVAIGEQELPILDTLYQQGVKNGVPGMKIISAAEMLEREPLINPEVSGALWASTGGICDPFQVTVAAAENAVLNGAEVLLETEEPPSRPENTGGDENVPAYEGCFAMPYFDVTEPISLQPAREKIDLICGELRRARRVLQDQHERLRLAVGELSLLHAEHRREVRIVDAEAASYSAALLTEGLQRRGLHAVAVQANQEYTFAAALLQ